jgi:hypothetical protein
MSAPILSIDTQHEDMIVRLVMFMTRPPAALGVRSNRAVASNVDNDGVLLDGGLAANASSTTRSWTTMASGWPRARQTAPSRCTT